MTQNPQQLAYQALAYDSIANLPTGRCSALTITVRSYSTHAAEWTIMVPYRATSHPDGFALFTPLLIPNNSHGDYNALLMHAFYSGVTMINLPGDPWHSHLIEV